MERQTAQATKEETKLKPKTENECNLPEKFSTQVSPSPPAEQRGNCGSALRVLSTQPPSAHTSSKHEFNANTHQAIPHATVELTTLPARGQRSGRPHCNYTLFIAGVMCALVLPQVFCVKGRTAAVVPLVRTQLLSPQYLHCGAVLLSRLYIKHEHALCVS